MPIPKHNELRVPVLEFLKAHGASTSKEMITPLSESFKLTPEEVNQMYESGNGPVFKDRIAWALTYLGFTDLVLRPKRGVYDISPKGIEMLKTPSEVDSYIEKSQAQREALKNNKEEISTLPIPIDKAAPQEKLTPQENCTNPMPT